MILAGLPAIIVFLGKDFTTTEPAPIETFEPISIRHHKHRRGLLKFIV
jgi:hypothetical protein